MDARTIPPTRDVALLLGSAGGVSGKGSGASPSQDALNLVRWSLARGFLDPRRDRLVAVHCSELNPLTASTARVTHELVTPSEFPEWMPPALAHAFGRFAARGGGKGAAAALLESPLAPPRRSSGSSPASSAASPRRHSARLAAFAERGCGIPPRRRETGRRRTAHRLYALGIRIRYHRYRAFRWTLARGRRGAVAASTRRRRCARSTSFWSARATKRSAFEALRRAALGSVSRRVLERSPAPVLVVRARDAPSLGVRERRRVRAAAGERGRTRKATRGPAVPESGGCSWTRMRRDGNGIFISSSERGTAHDTRIPEMTETTERVALGFVSRRGGGIRAGRSGDARRPENPGRRTNASAPATSCASRTTAARTASRSCAGRCGRYCAHRPRHRRRSRRAGSFASGARRGSGMTRKETRRVSPAEPRRRRAAAFGRDVARAVAAFGRERPPPATAPASSARVGAGEALELAKRRVLSPAPRRYARRRGIALKKELGPFLPRERPRGVRRSEASARFCARRPSGLRTSSW